MLQYSSQNKPFIELVSFNYVIPTTQVEMHCTWGACGSECTFPVANDLIDQTNKYALQNTSMSAMHQKF